MSTRNSKSLDGNKSLDSSSSKSLDNNANQSNTNQSNTNQSNTNQRNANANQRNNNNERNNADAPRKRKYDPDGTMSIARGYTRRELGQQEARLQALLHQTPRALDYLPDAHDAARLRLLQYSDKHTQPLNTDTHADRALARRQADAKHLARRQWKSLRESTARVEAAIDAARASEILATNAGGSIESTDKSAPVSQLQFRQALMANNQSTSNLYDLVLHEYGPCGLKYDRSGRYGVVYGKLGLVALVNQQTMSKLCEFHVESPINDACFLHNYTLFALAQRDGVYIYDHLGAQVHFVKNDALALDFLPYHWLLTSVSARGNLRYQDTSTGQPVANVNTHLPVKCMRQNTMNAVMHVGHLNGTVTLWSPAQNKYLVKMHCHKGASVQCMAIDQYSMVTGGADRMVHLWDLRKFDKTVHSTKCSSIPTSIDVSAKNMLAVGFGAHISIYKSVQEMETPYLHHCIPKSNPITTIRYRPFEDICGIGHARGVSTMLVPGCGEPQIDSSEYNTNPYQDSKQRREEEVRALLDKLSPGMISLDPNQIGGITPVDASILRKYRMEQQKKNKGYAGNHTDDDQDGKDGGDSDDNEDEQDNDKGRKMKSKKRGRSKVSLQIKRKQAMRDSKSVSLQRGSQGQPERKPDALKATAPRALQRFY
jgi:U3 small nucleolar RNA-associated protein 7